MTEEQKQLTLGQVAETKRILEENIKNQLNDFIKQTGCHSLEINGWCAATRSLGENDTVVYDMNGSVTINLLNFLND